MNKKRMGWFDLEFTALCGVFLPGLTLLVECIFHMCAGVYVDPIPSWWHVTAIAFVSLANFVAWLKLMKDQADTKWLPFVIGTSIGVSAFYAAVFAPMVPMGVVLIVALGLGFLPLAPVLAFLSAVRLAFIARRMRRELATPANMKGLLAGIGVGVLFLVGAELPNLFTQIGLRQAVATQPEISRAGVRLLRTFGSEQAVLRSCYRHMASVSDIPSLVFSAWHVQQGTPWLAWHEENHPLTVEEAREVYYRTYGHPFNSVARPTFSTGIRGSDLLDDDMYWNWDDELAGENVGARQAGVSLASSSLVAAVDPNLATSYSEWTMKFTNQSYTQQEARMQIELPPGGVVSRATLWVNGVQREAAFGERGLVRHAYQAVVASKRDPLLVTSVGPNKIMLQCFPVPPKIEETPGVMQVRIGITAPCVVPSLGEAQLVLPRIAEHGFPVKCKHEIRVDGPTPMTASVEDSKMRNEPIVVHEHRDAKVAAAFTQAPLSQGKSFVLAQLQQAKREKPSQIYVVVDGAAAMAKYIPDVADALAKIPQDVPTQVRFASDEISSLTDAKDKSDLTKALQELRHAPCVGGPDNMHLLADVWAEAKNKPNSAVVWIHGPQPILFGGQELTDKFDGAPTLYDVEIYASPNRLVEKMPRQTRVVDVRRTASLRDDIEKFVTALCGTSEPAYVVARSVAPAKPDGATETVMPSLSAQLVSLWAYDETLNLIAKGDEKGAVKLAARNKLVTPVTGAVVLETDADYKKNGIDPKNSDNNDASKASTPVFQIGAAPEPEEYALMIVALCAVAWMVWRKRLQNRHA
jgi:hypothetical protein